MQDMTAAVVSYRKLWLHSLRSCRPCLRVLKKHPGFPLLELFLHPLRQIVPLASLTSELFSESTPTSLACQSPKQCRRHAGQKERQQVSHIGSLNFVPTLNSCHVATTPHTSCMGGPPVVLSLTLAYSALL